MSSSRCWHFIHQMAGQGVDSPSVLQLLRDDPQDDKNLSFEVGGTKEVLLDGGYVSC
jgi:hypothetical protein